MTAELLADVLDRVRARREDSGTEGSPSIRRFVAGERLLLVVLDGGAGVAHRPPAALPAGDAVRGADAFELAEWAVDPPAGSGDPKGARAVGLAALNALSAPLVDWRAGDPMAALSGDVDTIGTVGLFRPAFRKFGAVDVRVVERAPIDEDALDPPPGVSVSTFDPADVPEALAGAEVLFVTGSALIYGGADRYLDAAGDTTVVLIGATASFLPGPAFDAGVSLLAGARVTDADRVAEGIRAGACGTDLHGAGLQKVFVAAESGLPGLELDPR